MQNVAEWSDERLCTALAAFQNGEASELRPQWAMKALSEYEKRAGIAPARVDASDLMKKIRGW